MGFGRTRCAAATVSARFPADKHDYIASLRHFAHDVLRGSRAYYKARFQPLCRIARMVVFAHFARRKPYLIAVRRIAFCRALAYYALRQFAFERFIERRVDVRRARNAHCLIHIRPARQRVAYRAAQACRRAAERLDFRRVVVRFVFKKHVPRFDRPVFHYNVLLDRARVDFGRNVHRRRVTVFAQHLCADCRNVHKRRILVVPAVIHEVEHIRIVGVSLFYMRVVRFDFCF